MPQAVGERTVSRSAAGAALNASVARPSGNCSAAAIADSTNVFAIVQAASTPPEPRTIAKTFVESAMAAAEQFPDGRATEALRAAPAALLETVLSPTA